jgi:hypothetical protein
MKYPYEKYYNSKGEVAVIYSPGYGAGWSTWNSELGEAAIFDKDLVEALLANDHLKVASIAESKYPDAYAGGLEKASIEWVPIGSQFDILEYDGSERVRIIGPSSHYIA